MVGLSQVDAPHEPGVPVWWFRRRTEEPDRGEPTPKLLTQNQVFGSRQTAGQGPGPKSLLIYISS